MVEKSKLLRSSSPYGHFDSYKLRPLIVKGGDDLRQELICMQVMQKLKNIFDNAGINLWIRIYDIIVISANSGIIGKPLLPLKILIILLEFIPDTISLDGLKKNVKNYTSLFDFYNNTFDYDFEEA